MLPRGWATTLRSHRLAEVPGEDPATIKCPRCKTEIDSAPDRAGLVVCPGCGAKLRSRPPAAAQPKAPVPPAGRAAPGMDFDSMLDSLDGPPGGASPPAPEPPRAPATPATPAKRNPTATLPPGTPLKKIPRPEDRAALDAVGAPPTVPTAALDVLLAEVRAVRRLQEEMLALLRRRTPPDSAPDTESGEETGAEGLEPGFTVLDEVLDSAPAPLRARRSKSVLLIDDDPKARAEAVAALEAAQVPVRTATDGSAGLAAIAQERPDVIVLELDLKGSMAGKDVVNMIKATMEWVDIPLILYTRAAIGSQKEARTVHGADEYVIKGPAGAETLLATIVAVFRRG